MSEDPRSLRRSVLDRLQEPDRRVRNRFERIRELKRNLRRDLQDLLNTRRRASVWAAQLEELDSSLVAYGLPDFSGSQLGTQRARDRFCQTVAETVTRFETRLSKVRVIPDPSPAPVDRVLRFRIVATLDLDPEPEEVVFDSSIEPLTANFEIEAATT